MNGITQKFNTNSRHATSTEHLPQLMDYVQEIEKNLGVKAKLNLMPMQDGDIKKSHADVDGLVKDFEYSPKWNIQNGIKNFIQWYIDYYNVKLTK